MVSRTQVLGPDTPLATPGGDEPAATRPWRASGGVPVKGLCVDVLKGQEKGRSVTARSDTLSVGTARDNDLVLTDSTVSRYHLELSARDDGIRVIDHGSTNGTMIGNARVERATVRSGTILRLGRTHLRVSDGGSVTVATVDSGHVGELWGKTDVMRRLMAEIERVAASEVPVLLIGESGTGKELIARALYELGPRQQAPFVTVDCASLLPNLVASELFGHERGAFTGASDRHIGAFERAQGGTLFLDELGDLPLALQPTLLGALERRTFRRVGGTEDLPFDARVIGATHHDLRSAVNAKTFRLDLYYRLAVVTLHVPPLRERAADVPLLVEHFLRRFGYRGPVADVVPPDKMQELCGYRWPGNVRELRNLVESSLALGQFVSMDTDRGTEASAVHSSGSTTADLIALPYKEARAECVNRFEAEYLSHWLIKAGGNISRAARLAGMDRSHLSNLLHRHRLNPRGDNK